MSALNENEMIIAELINVDTMPITEAQILATDYEGDDSAEFYCQFINTMTYFESFLEDPEKLCIPDEDGEIPYVEFIEMMNELTGFKWAKRTWNRMEARTAGVEPEERLTQLQKAEHPDYKDWLCLKCLYYYKGAKMLKLHQDRNICQEKNATLFVKSNKNKLPSAKFYHTALVLNDLIAKAELYKKSIEPELVEEVIEEEYKPDYKYYIKTFEYNQTTKNIDYTGLWEDSETGNKEFKTEEEAREAFGYATEGDKGYIAVELIEYDGSRDVEIRENVIEEWEDNIDEYIEEEDEDLDN